MLAQDRPNEGASKHAREQLSPEPDVWWGEDGIDAGLGLQLPPYIFVPNSATQREE